MRISTALVILSGLAAISAAPKGSPLPQHVLSGTTIGSTGPSSVHTEALILSTLERISDPVEAMIALDATQAEILAEPRLLEVFDGSAGPSTKWMTEGDKLRLRRQEIDFIDWTGRNLVPADFEVKPSRSYVSVLFLSC